MDLEKNKNTARVWHQSLGMELSEEFYDSILHKDFSAYMFGQPATRAQYIQTEKNFSRHLAKAKRP